MGQASVSIVGVLLLVAMTALAVNLMPPSLVAPPPPATLASVGEPGSFVENFNGKLIALDYGTVRNLDMADLKKVKYWAFYWSASWCPPCRAFTPRLVEFYKSFKPTHPNFELVLLDEDQSEGGMLNYMSGEDMTWPAVRYSELGNPTLSARNYMGHYIPDLVLVDNDGNMISGTAQGGHVAAEQVMNDIPRLVPTP